MEVGGDPVRPYVLLLNSHDGSTAVVAATTPVRVVCQNTLNWGLRDARQKCAIRHTDAVLQRVHEARRVLELSIDYYQQFKRLGDGLALERCSERQLRGVLEELYPSGTGDAASSRAQRSRVAPMSRSSRYLRYLGPFLAHVVTSSFVLGSCVGALSIMIVRNWRRCIPALL